MPRLVEFGYGDTRIFINPAQVASVQAQRDKPTTLIYLCGVASATLVNEEIGAVVEQLNEALTGETP